MAGFNSYEAMHDAQTSKAAFYVSEPATAELACRFEPETEHSISIEVSPPGTTLSYAFVHNRQTVQCTRTLRQTGWGVAKITHFVANEPQLDELLRADEFFEGRVRYFDRVKHIAMRYFNA